MHTLVRSAGRFCCGALMVLCACRDTGNGARAAAATWTLPPVLTLGVAEGNPAQEFGRVMNAVKLSDGRIAVADMLNSEVRMFHPDGTHDRSFGRRGEGPGEFRLLTRLGVAPGDTLLAGGVSGIARFAADGTYLDQVRPPWTELNRPPYHIESIWPLAGGTFLVLLLEASRGAPASAELDRSGKMYLLADASPAVVDSLGTFGGLEQLTYQEGGRSHTAIPLFPADTRAVSSARHVAIGDMASDSVLLYDMRDRSRRWVRIPLRRERIPGDALATARERACDWTSSEEDRTRCEVNLRHLPPQESYPVFRELAVDSAGRLWMGLYAHSVTDTVAAWLVLDGSGRALARAELPPTLRITQIGESYLLGIARDSVGVETVREFRIVR